MWYRLCRRVIHSLQANNRHGTHSPFAYQFVELVLNSPNVSPVFDIEFPWQPLPREYQLLQRLVNAYGADKRIYQSSTIGSGAVNVYVLLPGATFRRPSENDIVVVPGIFDSPDTYENWKALSQLPEIPMSIETDVMGLLFFRKEFLIKQHFRLKRG